MLTSALLAFVAVLLDWFLGEPKRYHPLVGFGHISHYVENRLYGANHATPGTQKLRGIIAVAVLILPLTLIVWYLTSQESVNLILSVLILYLALGHKSLHEHARPVAEALSNGDSEQAQLLAGRMVSRDTDTLDSSSAVTESVLENGNDAVFAALFWFIVAGAPGVLAYRLSNTLDAMWGYRNERYRHFGFAAARLDDVMNYLPARLTAMTYALVAFDFPALSKQLRPRTAFTHVMISWNCWQTQAWAWESPNAGPVMAAGAGALGVSIGGPACYRGEWQQRPTMGAGAAPEAWDIERALHLIRKGVSLWLSVLLVIGVIVYV